MKTEKLKKLVLTHDIDFVSLVEVNKDWRKVSHDNSIWGATESWCKNRRVQVSQNSTKPPRSSEWLVGGTASVAFNELVFRISAQGQDYRKLGRWNFVTITGKNDIKTTIFTCYCPVICKSPGSTYSQHLTYMAENTEEIPEVTCPRQLFGIDLKNAIENRLDSGHQIIVMGDFNSEYTKLKDWMLDLGLKELIEERHGAGPKTYKRSKDAPIDCIFGSAHLGIKQGGFLSFDNLMGDHRGIWMDIPKFLLYGYNPPQINTYRARRLRLEDPRVVQKYQDYLYQAMVDQDLFYRMEIIHRATTYPLPQWLQEEYEKVDKIVCNLMDKAEAQCRKLRTGTIPWSPTYQKCNLVLEYWLMRKSYFHKEHYNVRQLIVLQNKLKITYDPTLSYNDIVQKVVKASKDRKKSKLLAESLSREYRTQLAIAKEEAGEMTAATYLKTRNRIEAQRRLYRNIRYMEGKIKGECTSKVITTVNGQKVEHTDKKSIEQLIAQENEAKYHQTEGGSQLLDPVFIDSLGSFGEGKDIPSVLDGTYVPPIEASTATADYISACTFSRQQSSLIGTKTTSQRYTEQVSSWVQRKEITCTHNHHIGHYKVVFKDERLNWFFFQRADVPEISGYSPKRHKHCVDLMIMKKAQCYEVSKLRTIGILDTEYNQMNKRVGHEGMNNAFKLKRVAKEQFAVNNSAAIDQIVAKRCFIDHNRFKRTCFCLTSSDLKGCYDRIIHIAAALALLRVGIPHSTIHSMFSTIQHMVHCVRTSFGDSELTYGGEDISAWENFAQGVLQGNASGPTIWSLISSVIFEILHKRGLSVELCTSISKQVFLLVGFAYVDDCDLIQSGSDPLVVLQSMQKLIQSWGSLMEVTGGALSVEKSWWYLVKFVYCRGKWVAQDAELDAELIAKSETGEDVPLQRLHVEEASKMLGVWIAPDGNNIKIVQELKKAACEWGCKVRLGNPSRLEAWQALHTNISARLKYPLPACTLIRA